LIEVDKCQRRGVAEEINGNDNEGDQDTPWTATSAHFTSKIENTSKQAIALVSLQRSITFYRDKVRKTTLVI
jgi:hypothetical protein